MALEKKTPSPSLEKKIPSPSKIKGNSKKFSQEDNQKLQNLQERISKTTKNKKFRSIIFIKKIK